MSGEVGRLRDALRQVVFRLREDALKDKESNQNVRKDTNQSVPLHSSSLSVPQVLPENPPRAPLSYDHRVETERGLGGFSGSSLYGYNTMPVCLLYSDYPFIMIEVVI